MKFEDAYFEYLKYVKIKQKKQSRETLEQRFRSKILPFFRDFYLNEIDESLYLDWQSYILSFNLSSNYNKGLHYLMCAFFDYCVLFLDFKVNIARRVGQFKLKNVKVKHDFYTLNEFKKFIKGFDNEIYKQFFNLMFFAGTRPGEAMALRFSDLNYCSISINKTISEHFIDGSRVIDDPKSLSSFRTIDIDYKLYKNLLKLKKIYIDKFSDSSYDYFIFGGLKPLSPTSINRIKKRVCLKVGIRPIKLHEFRHSHASLLNSYHVSLQSIKERLGHSDVRVTSDVYVHTTEYNKKRITRILNLLRLVI